MENNKGYDFNFNSQRGIGVNRAQQREMLLGLRRGHEAVFAELPADEACSSRLAQYAKNLAKFAGITLVHPGQNHGYYYEIKNNGGQTQLAIGRR